MLALLFLLGGGLVVAASQHMPELRQVLTLGAELLAAAIAFALLAALLMFHLLTRRLHLLAQEIAAFRASRFTQPRRLHWARDDGDEIDRLAHDFGELCDRISQQLAELQQHDVQRRELLANVSHDLRTPLTLMRGYLDTLLLRHGELGRPEVQGCLQVAARHAERLGRLVDDLFELARLERPADPAALEVFSLGELAQDIAQKFALPAGERGQRIEARLQGFIGSTVPVCGDIGLVERALENLVENALRHTPEGGSVGIDIAPDATQAPGRVRISVSDTGCGIAPEHLPHVFDRYFQAQRVEDSADAARHHAGLGLAITQRIVALHGGTIRVDSTLGQGTVFSFDLPLASGHAPLALRPPAGWPAALPAGPAPGAAGSAPHPQAGPAQQAEAACRQADAARRLAEQRLALALRGAQDGLWELAPGAGQLQVSARWQHMLGRQADGEATLALADWQALVHPDDRDAVLQALQQVLADGSERYEQVLRLRHADGRYLWVLSRGSLVRHASGTPSRLIGVDTDITRTKRIERLVEALAEGTAARSGEGFFRALVQHFAQALQVDSVFITEYAGARHARTLAAWQRGGWRPGGEYPLAGTPCEQVLQQGRRSFIGSGLGRQFPREAGCEGYLGLPLFSRDGRVIGHLAFLHGQALAEDRLLESVCRIFTARAAAEIEWLQAQRRRETAIRVE